MVLLSKNWQSMCIHECSDLLVPFKRLWSITPPGLWSWRNYSNWSVSQRLPSDMKTVESPTVSLSFIHTITLNWLKISSTTNYAVCTFVKQLVEMKSQKQADLDVDERNLLSVAYKNVVGSKRASWSVFIDSFDCLIDHETLSFVDSLTHIRVQ